MMYPVVDVNGALLSLSLALEQLASVAQKGGPAMAHVADDIWGTYGQASASDSVHFFDIRTSGTKKLLPFISGTSRICWLSVPAYKDSVLVSLNHKAPTGYLFKNDGTFLIEPGVIAYIDPYTFKPLDPGLFCWRNAWNELRQGFGKPYKDKGECIGTTPNDIQGSDPARYASISANRHPNDKAVRKWIYHDIVDRNQAFEYVMGMTEKEFREKLGVEQHLTVSTAKGGFGKLYINLPDRVKRLFPGSIDFNFAQTNSFTSYPVRLLRYNYPHFPKKPTIPGRLFLIKKSEFDKQKKGYVVDIRYLQSHFPGAVFQIASTFSCMEGGVQFYKNYLNEMNDKAVQGENAVLGTISGAIVRRYFVEPAQRNLLDKLKSIFEGTERNWRPSITGMRGNKSYKYLIDNTTYDDLDKIMDKSQALYLALSGAVQVGVHTNIFVTSGSWGEHDIQLPRSDAPGKRTVPAFDRFIDDPRRVHHVYTSAVNIDADKFKKKPGVLKFLRQYDDAIPKMALRATYEGTLLASWNLFKEMSKPSVAIKDLADFLNEDPILAKRPRVFLTLVGAGAFKNEPEWIVTILEQLQALIYHSGLQIGLVLWDEDKKVRNVIGTLEKLAERIEGGNVELLSEHAAKAGEKLWLFNADGSFRSPVTSRSSSITVPFKTLTGGEVELGIWQ